MKTLSKRLALVGIGIVLLFVSVALPIYGVVLPSPLYASSSGYFVNLKISSYSNITPRNVPVAVMLSLTKDYTVATSTGILGPVDIYLDGALVTTVQTAVEHSARDAGTTPAYASATAMVPIATVGDHTIMAKYSGEEGSAQATVTCTIIYLSPNDTLLPPIVFTESSPSPTPVSGDTDINDVNPVLPTSSPVDGNVYKNAPKPVSANSAPPKFLNYFSIVGVGFIIGAALPASILSRKK